MPQSPFIIDSLPSFGGRDIPFHKSIPAQPMEMTKGDETEVFADRQVRAAPPLARYQTREPIRTHPFSPILTWMFQPPPGSIMTVTRYLSEACPNHTMQTIPRLVSTSIKPLASSNSQSRSIPLRTNCHRPSMRHSIRQSSRSRPKARRTPPSLSQQPTRARNQLGIRQ